MKNSNRLFGLFAGLAAAAILVVTPASAQVLPIGDDNSVEVDLGFTFGFCGTDYTSVWVNANGNLTFGSGDIDFSESASEMLGDQPRIAALWDDLNASQGGTVSATKTSNSVTINYDDVPEWFSSGSNTFSVTLNKSSNSINIEIGDISVTDGLIGVSCGGQITIGNEPGVDISEVAGNGNTSLRNSAAYYQLFGSNDTANTSYSFSAPNFFHDNNEPNNVLGDAKNVQLPYNSGDDRGNSGGNFTAIAASADPFFDRDFFSFQATADTTLLVEITNGELDTFIGLWDPSGTLVATDDDDGVGLLSKLTVPIFAGGQYTVGVTTYPDFDFAGTGGFTSGRYVLNIEAVDGFVLDLPDDGFEEVPFGCAGGFTYQGTNYSSVFVNSNGNLTFGSGDTDFSESVSELLNDQPRIAALWDDLSPNNGGTVSVEFSADSLTVNFDEVPEFISTGANTFSVTMTCSTGDVSITYGDVSATDGLVGVTEGGGAANPGETDLSAGGPYSVSGTTYELFTGDFDLDNTTVDFD